MTFIKQRKYLLFSIFGHGQNSSHGQRKPNDCGKKSKSLKFYVLVNWMFACPLNMFFYLTNVEEQLEIFCGEYQLSGDFWMDFLPTNVLRAA